MRRINVARQGRNRKTGCRLSRISDAVLRRLDKQKSSSINWWSSNYIRYYTLNKTKGEAIMKKHCVVPYAQFYHERKYAAEQKQL